MDHAHGTHYPSTVHTPNIAGLFSGLCRHSTPSWPATRTIPILQNSPAHRDSVCHCNGCGAFHAGSCLCNGFDTTVGDLRLFFSAGLSWKGTGKAHQVEGHLRYWRTRLTQPHDCGTYKIWDILDQWPIILDFEDKDHRQSQRPPRAIAPQTIEISVWGLTDATIDTNLLRAESVSVKWSGRLACSTATICKGSFRRSYQGKRGQRPTDIRHILRHRSSKDFSSGLTRLPMVYVPSAQRQAFRSILQALSETLANKFWNSREEIAAAQPHPANVRHSSASYKDQTVGSLKICRPSQPRSTI
jgi:hypothetical protein